MKNETVSVIMPMYNSEQYIAQTIESVQAQTRKDWELWIVDDVSTDRSADIAQSYAAGDGRIHYYPEKEKAGVARARNDGIRLSAGRYLAFLDSDDLWLPEKLERQMEFMRRAGVPFVYSGCEVIDGDGRRTGKIRKVPEHLTYRQYLRGNVIPCLTVLLDQSAFREIEMPQIGHEDYATWLALMEQCGEAAGINEPLALYRVHGGSVSHKKWQTIAWTWNIFHRERGFGMARSAFYTGCHILKSARKYL